MQREWDTPPPWSYGPYSHYGYAPPPYQPPQNAYQGPPSAPYAPTTTTTFPPPTPGLQMYSYGASGAPPRPPSNRRRHSESNSPPSTSSDSGERGTQKKGWGVVATIDIAGAGQTPGAHHSGPPTPATYTSATLRNADCVTPSQEASRQVPDPNFHHFTVFYFFLRHCSPYCPTAPNNRSLL